MTSFDEIFSIDFEGKVYYNKTYIPGEMLELQGLKYDRTNIKAKLKEAESRKRTGSSMMKKYYEKREKTLLADLSDIDSRMAELEQILNHSGEEGEGLSADVVQDEALDSGGDSNTED